MSALGGVIGSAIFSTAVTMLLLPGAIRVLRRVGIGKTIRSEGPARHAAKSGTPTMGGAVMVAAAAASTLVFSPDPAAALLMATILVAYGVLGSLDDLRALRLHRAMGLRAREKFLGQTLLALLFSVWALRVLPEATLVSLPFSAGWWALSPVLFAALAVLATVGTANAVNLTDGLDGLAAGSVAVASAVYAAVALLMDKPSVAVFAASVGGACLGFMWYNGYPAQVFMGDTGSLALGAGLSAMAIFTGTVLTLPLVGGLFVAETLSVMAQVGYFKLTGGRRLFRMSPFHHHLELMGWAEPQVVVRLWLTAILCGLLGLWAMLPAIRG